MISVSHPVALLTNLLFSFIYVEEINLGNYYRGSFFNISRGFNFANSLPVEFSRGFIFANLSFINVLSMIFYWFVFQLEVCESRNSYASFSISQIALFEHERLILDRMPSRRRSKGADIIKYLHFSFYVVSTYCLISCKIFLTWPSLIERESNVNM